MGERAAWAAEMQTRSARRRRRDTEGRLKDEG
jgi:hypothetical protein